MSTLAEFRAKFPGLDKYSDHELVGVYAKGEGIGLDTARYELGVEAPNADGTISALKRSVGSTVGGIGELYADVTGDQTHSNALTRFDDRVQQNNPSEINSLEDIANKPWLAARVAVGGALGFMGPGLAGKALGLAGRGLGMARVAQAGEALNSFGAQTAIAGLPSLRSIGEDQRRSGEEPNDLLKYAAAGTVGAVENLFGVQRLLGIGRGPIANAERAALQEAGKTPWRTAGKTFLGTTAGEAGEELLQNPIEQFAGYKDPTSEKNVQETLFGGAMGALGGATFGLLGGARAGLRHRGIRNDLRSEGYIAPDGGTPTDLLQASENRDYDRYLDPARQEANRFQTYRTDPLSTVDPRYTTEEDIAGQGPSIIDRSNRFGAAKVPDKLHKKRQAEYDKLFNEGSGVYASDAKTGIERELSNGEWNEVQTQPASITTTSSYDPSNGDLPPLKNLGDAVAVLELAHRQKSVPTEGRKPSPYGDALAVGTPLYARVVEAQAMLDAAGLKYKPVAVTPPKPTKPTKSEVKQDRKGKVNAELTARLETFKDMIGPELYAKHKAELAGFKHTLVGGALSRYAKAAEALKKESEVQNAIQVDGAAGVVPSQQTGPVQGVGGVDAQGQAAGAGQVAAEGVPVVEAPVPAAQVAPVESDAEKKVRLQMRPKPAELVLDPTLPISIGAQWMLHDFTTEGPIAEKVHRWQEVAKENGVPATDFATTIAALQAKLGAPNGNNGQSVRTGGSQNGETQVDAGQEAVVVASAPTQSALAAATGEAEQEVIYPDKGAALRAFEQMPGGKKTKRKHHVVENPAGGFRVELKVRTPAQIAAGLANAERLKANAATSPGQSAATESLSVFVSKHRRLARSEMLDVIGDDEGSMQLGNSNNETLFVGVNNKGGATIAEAHKQAQDHGYVPEGLTDSEFSTLLSQDAAAHTSGDESGKVYSANNTTAAEKRLEAERLKSDEEYEATRPEEPAAEKTELEKAIEERDRLLDEDTDTDAIQAAEIKVQALKAQEDALGALGALASRFAPQLEDESVVDATNVDPVAEEERAPTAPDLTSEELAAAETAAPALEASLDEVLDNKDKQVVTQHYGVENSFGSKTKQLFLEGYSKWLLSANRAAHKLAYIFKKVAKAAGKLILAAAVAVSFSNTQVKTAQASMIPVQTIEITDTKTVTIILPRADFKGVAVSSDVKRVADWRLGVLGGKAKFLIADKITAMLYVFDESGVLIAKTAALFGQTPGDIAPKIENGKTGKDYLSNLKPEQRITPAGVFPITPSMGAPYGAPAIDYQEIPGTGGVTMAVHTVPQPKEQAQRVGQSAGATDQNRDKRLASPTPSDNKITSACINVPLAFANDVLGKHFPFEGADDAVDGARVNMAESPDITIMPEHSSANKFFPMMGSGKDTTTEVTTKTTMTTGGMTDTATSRSLGSDLLGTGRGEKRGSGSRASISKRRKQFSNSFTPQHQQELGRVLELLMGSAFDLGRTNIKQAVLYVKQAVNRVMGDFIANQIPGAMYEDAFNSAQKGGERKATPRKAGLVLKARMKKLRSEIETRAGTVGLNQELRQVIGKLYDAVFKLGHIKFVTATKHVQTQMRNVMGAKLVDTIPLEVFKAAYNQAGVRDGPIGASTRAQVSAVTALDDERPDTGFDPKKEDLFGKLPTKGKPAAKRASTDEGPVPPEDIEDPDHREAVEMFLAGESLRGISLALGVPTSATEDMFGDSNPDSKISHVTWNKILNNYGYSYDSKKAEDEASSGDIGKETPEVESDVTTSPITMDDDGSVDYAPDVRDDGLQNRARPNSGGMTSAVNDKKQVKDTEAALKKFSWEQVTKVEIDLKKLHRSLGGFSDAQQLFLLERSVESKAPLGQADVVAADELGKGLRSKVDETKIEAKRRADQENTVVAQLSNDISKGMIAIFKGSVEGEADLVRLLSNKQFGQQLMKYVWDHLGKPKIELTPENLTKFIAYSGVFHRMAVMNSEAVNRSEALQAADDLAKARAEVATLPTAKPTPRLTGRKLLDAVKSTRVTPAHVADADNLTRRAAATGVDLGVGEPQRQAFASRYGMESWGAAAKKQFLENYSLWLKAGGDANDLKPKAATFSSLYRSVLHVATTEGDVFIPVPEAKVLSTLDMVGIADEGVVDTALVDLDKRIITSHYTAGNIEYDSWLPGGTQAQPATWKNVRKKFLSEFGKWLDSNNDERDSFALTNFFKAVLKGVVKAIMIIAAGVTINTANVPEAQAAMDVPTPPTQQSQVREQRAVRRKDYKVGSYVIKDGTTTLLEVTAVDNRPWTGVQELTVRAPDGAVSTVRSDAVTTGIRGPRQAKLFSKVTRRDFLKGGAALVAWAAGGKALAATPAQVAAFKAVVAKKDIAATLNWIAANSANPKFRTLAATIKKLLPAGDKIRLRILPNPSEGELGVTQIDRVGGKVIVTLYSSDVAAHNGVDESTLLHEAIHAVLVARYDYFSYYAPNKNKLGTHKADPAIDQYVAVWREFSAMVEKETGGKGPAWLIAPAANPDEFITYVLTSPELQAWLKERKYKGKTLWASLKESFLRMLGMSTEPSWFDAAMTVSDSVLAAASEDAPDFAVSKELKRLVGDRADAGDTLAARYAAPANAPKTVAEVQSFTESTVAQMITSLKESAKDYGNAALQKLVFMHDLIPIAVRAGITSAKGFDDLMGSKDQLRNRMEQRVDQLMSRASALEDDDKKKAEAFIRESTLSSRWGYQPSFITAPVTIDPDRKKEYQALSPEARKVVEEIFEHGDSSYKELQRLAALEVNREYDELVARYPQKAAEYNKDRAKTLAHQARALPPRNGPYAPLQRFGDHVVVARSQQYKAAEKAGDQKAMDRLIADKSRIHYLVEFFDTAGAAAVRRDVLAQQFGTDNVVSSRRQENFKEVDELPWSGIAKIKSKIEESPDSRAKSAMQHLVTNLYLQMLADSSARKAELNRRGQGVYGSADMFRAFASHGRSNAHFLASMAKAKEINRQLTAMRGEAHDADNATRPGATRVLNEIMARYAQGLEYNETPLANKVLRVSSLWMLLTSPAYYLTNATQPYMMTMPVLGGRYGAKAFTEITKAYGDITAVVANMGKELDVTKLPITQAEKDMLVELRDKGKLDLSMSTDLGRWAGKGADQGILSTALMKLDHTIARVEALNRITTALAAYRLSGGSTEYAGEMVDVTQGNYGAGNAPRFFHKNAGTKLITQFRKYQLIQISLLGRLLHDSFKGASAAERAVARQAFAWLMTQQMVMTGLKGLPIPAVIYMLAAALGGDDDKDWERNLRKWIGNDMIATLLIRGVPAALGLDVSGRIGMGNAFSILPFSDIDFTKAGYKEAVFGLSGAAIGGLGLQLADGIERMGKGQYYRGVEAMLPKGLKDMMAGYRLGTKGVVDNAGTTTMSADEIGFFAAAMKGVGLPTTGITEHQTGKHDLYELGKHFTEREGRIKSDYVSAVKEADSGDMADARSEWMEVQAAKKRWYDEMARRGFNDKHLLQNLKPDPLSTLLKHPSKVEKKTGYWTAAANR